jgi:hypothetical protein
MIFSPFSAIPLFFVMLILLEVGRRFKVRTGLEPNTTIENADFALFGLLLAFTFSGSIERFDSHRELITEELNTIDTAYRRLDVLPPETQPPIRQLFRDYVTSRLNQYQNETTNREVSPETRRLQDEIWTQSVAAASVQGKPSSASIILLPALNNMIDITSTRRNAFNMHPPTAVFLLLFFLSCLCAVIAGFVIRLDRYSWTHMVAFAGLVSLTIGAILDIEYPSEGLIRLTSYDNLFVALRDSMK